MAEAVAKPGMREMMEIMSGQSLEDNFYQRPDAQEIVTKASNVLYGDIGANLDTRDWGAIMKSADPYKAAREGLKSMYSDPVYLVKNAENLLKQGYLPEQADFTYKQMESRVGSTYKPTWTAGSQFAGKLDTQGYLTGIANAGNDPAAVNTFTNSYWAKYGGNPTLTSGGSVVNTGSTNINTGSTTGLTPGTTTGATTGTTTGGTTGTTTGGTTGTTTGTTTGGTTGGTTGSTFAAVPNVATGSTPRTVYGPDGRPYASPEAALAAGVATYTLTKPAGLIANADLMGVGGGGTTSRIFATDNTTIGNTKPVGLIAAGSTQLVNPYTNVKLPTGIANPFAG
jgi:hypothetical protein